MVLSIEVVGAEEVERSLDETSDSLRNISEGIAFAIDTILLPEVYSQSVSVWNVRTGRYSSSWYRSVESNDSVLVGNDAGYSAPLEFGWITKARTYVESEGVLLPVAYENLDNMVELIAQWLKV